MTPRPARPRLLWLIAPLALLAACGEPSDRRAEEAPAEAEPSAQEALQLTPVGFDALPGWTSDDFEGALQALRRSCGRLKAQPADRALSGDALSLTAGDFGPACGALPDEAAAADPATVRAYFEAHFHPFAARDAADDDDVGLITGYFEAELTGAREPGDGFETPIYAAPGDLITADLGRFDQDLAGTRLVGRVEDGAFVPYPDRRSIEAGMLANRDLELLWIDDPVDVFLLQVQGSGRVVLPDGEVVRVGFAAHNGRPYRSIGRVLIERGELAPHAASWDGIRGWIDRNPARAAELFAENPRFVFFRLLETDADGPIGAQGVPLTPGRSLAVDRRFIPLGLPIWLDSSMPGEDGAPLRRLMVAQDVGGAIKGPVRGDFFWGYGDEALAQAGRMKSPGRFFLLAPKPAAERIAAAAPGS
ncbi:MAG: MltA domain-containing protein [Alphaproteobacteria bacterium]|nr:MltA domain-containing protein [Alphaproteobacteria bacterium]